MAFSKRLHLLAAAAVAVAIAVLPLAGGASAQSPTPADAPVLVYLNPKDGDVFNEPVFVLQLCFQAPVNIRDLPAHDGRSPLPGVSPTPPGDFNFSLTAPDGLGLGLRIVFQPDGYGLAVYPGEPPGETAGEWVFRWRVTNPDTLTPAEGEVRYTVDPSGGPIPMATPPACVDTGGTATPAEGAGATQTERVVSPTAEQDSVTPRGASPTGADVVDSEDDDGPDIGTLAFITIGAAGIAAVVGVVAYFVRRRVGYEPHKPQPGDDGQEEDH